MREYIKTFEKYSDNATTKSTRALKIWNGRVHGSKYERHHAYVAAYSLKQAAELLSMAFFGSDYKDLISTFEISKYYSKGAWGKKMDGIIPTEPCVYLNDGRVPDSKPFRVV